MPINPRAGDEISDGYVRDSTFGELAVKVNSGNVSLSTADIEVGKVKVLGSDGSAVADVLSAAPGSDTGQNGVAVRVISQLGAGTGGGAGGLTDTQLRATPVPVSGTVTATGPLTDAQLRAVAVPVSGTFFQATQPVSGTVTATGPLTDTQLRATAVPVSMATQNPDVTDRAARLLGHVTVDAAPTTAVTGPLTDTQLRASAVPISGTVTANQGGAPWADNVSQWGGAATTQGQKAAASSVPVVPASDWLTEPVPSGGFGNPALRVFPSSIRKATYFIPFRNIASGALTANTAKGILSLEHALASVKTVRVRRVVIGGRQTTLLAGSLEVWFTTGTAASSAGTLVGAAKANQAQAAAEVVAKTLPTISAPTASVLAPLLGSAAAAAHVIPPTTVYELDDPGAVEPFVLRAGVLESLVLNVISDAAMNLTLAGWVELTEE